MERLWVVIALVYGGCWPSDDGTLTPTQLEHLRRELTVQLGDPCQMPSGEQMPPARCQVAADFGQQLFFEPALSSNGAVACTTCHNPKKFFIDTRQANNLSFGVEKWTKRNSSTMVNLGLKFDLGGHRGVFTADGQRTSPGEVLDNAITGVPMKSTHDAAVTVIRETPTYNMLYNELFGPVPDATDLPGIAKAFGNLEVVFDAYLRQLVSIDAPFDHYLAGDRGAISDAAKRGFEVFVGRGQCLECHSGPLFTDLDFHNTGMVQTGPFAQADDGRKTVTGMAEDGGKFLTGSLRNIARTGPYMHDGAFVSLGEVIAFYGRGGDTNDFAGTKDPRIVPLGLTDDDVGDLEAFLETLDGAPIPDELTSDPRPHFKCLLPSRLCFEQCLDEVTDEANCGACDHHCDLGDVCKNGMCVPPLPGGT